MTKEELNKLKNEILVEITAKIGEILKEQLEPLSEALKILSPNSFKEQEDKFQRNALGIRIKRKEVLERDSFGKCMKKREEIQRDGWGRRIKRNFLTV